MAEYDVHYDLQQAFQAESDLIPRVTLYDYDPEKVYAAIMNRLAQPLPNGDPSPFAAQNPGSAHSIMSGALTYLLSISMHELNLSPDSIYLQMLRLHGHTIRQAEPAIVTLRFTKDPESIRRQRNVQIPAGLEIRSAFRQGVSCTTMDSVSIFTAEYAEVPARLNQVGAMEGLYDNEFSLLPNNLSFIESVATVGVASYGREAETIYEAATRARSKQRTGWRGVTDLDFQVNALELGAKKVNVVRGVAPDVDGYARDLRTVVVYPTGLSSSIRAELLAYKLTDERIAVVDANVIKVDGVVEVKALSTLQDLEVYNLVAAAIRDNLNPPFGNWGDREFVKTLSETLEQVVGIYAVPGMVLKNAETGDSIDFNSLRPWDLIEIQATLEVNIIRN
jgi:hypothetical protein